MSGPTVQVTGKISKQNLYKSFIANLICNFYKGPNIDPY